MDAKSKDRKEQMSKVIADSLKAAGARALVLMIDWPGDEKDETAVQLVMGGVDDARVAALILTGFKDALENLAQRQPGIRRAIPELMNAIRDAVVNGKDMEIHMDRVPGSPPVSFDTPDFKGFKGLVPEASDRPKEGAHLLPFTKKVRFPKS